ncbi:unannotated protein [freshwater metagenome]|uniref:Unannotated protein n=1 Tax=freshwater metagenome TaxID=449393 RepID=A0A6J7C4G9_9ZZZZ
MNAPARRASSSAKRVNMPTEPVALCWWWWSRKYEKNLTSSVSMADRTEASLRLHIVPWLERLQLASIADLTRHDVEDFMLHLAGMNHSAAPAPLRQVEYLTVQETARRANCSKSKLARLRAEGKLPNSTLADQPDSTRKVLLIASVDLPAVGLILDASEPARDGRHPVALQKRTAKEILVVLRLICDNAIAGGVMDKNPTLGVTATNPLPAAARYRADLDGEEVLTLAKSRELAAGLNVHHQLAFWIQRLLGLRAGEVFGILVEHLFTESDRPYVRVRLQGGRTMRVRDDLGNVVKTRSKEPKTQKGKRTLPVPLHLDRFIGAYLDAFHRREDGSLDGTRPLVCGFRDLRVPSSGTYLQALRAASRNLGIVINDDDIPGLSSHALRRSMSGELYNYQLADDSTRTDMLGQSAARRDDVSTTTQRRYTPSHKDLQRFLPVADGFDRLIDEQIGNIFVPTTHRAKLGKDNPLRDREVIAESVFQKHEYPRLGEVDIGGAQYVSVQSAADYLGLTVPGIRGRIRAGRLDTIRNELDGTRSIVMVSVDSLSKARNRTVTFSTGEAAEMLGISQWELWRKASEGLIESIYDESSGRYRFDAAMLESLRQDADRAKAIRARAVTLAEAQRRIGISNRAARVLLAMGKLDRDEAPTNATWIYVTLDSVERCRQELINIDGRQTEKADRVPLAEAVELTGLKSPELRALAASGYLDRCDIRSRTYFTRESLTRLMEKNLTTTKAETDDLE